MRVFHDKGGAALKTWKCIGPVASLVFVGSFGGSALARATTTQAAGVAATKIHIVTPFSLDRRPLKVPNGPIAKAACHVGSRFAVTNVYTCVPDGKLPEDPQCDRCRRDPCWAAPSIGSRMLVCADEPWFSSDPPVERRLSEVLVRSDQPLPPARKRSPLSGVPWGFTIKGEGCTIFEARYPTGGGNPTIKSACGGQPLLFVGNAINRQGKIWTIPYATQLGDANDGHFPYTARIIAAWFAGNGP